MTESIDHLRPFMSWAIETPTEEAQGLFVRRASEQWEANESFGYWMRERETGGLVGGAGLHPRIGPEAIEIGYWVHVEWTRRGFARAAARALTTAALAMPDICRVEIHCDEANVASAGVARGLGYRLDRIDDDEITAPGEIGRSMVWVMDSGSWLQT